MKLTIEINEEEIKAEVRARWQRQLSLIAAKQLQIKTQKMVDDFLEEQKGEFRELLKESLSSVLKQFHIRDLQHINKILGVKPSF